MFKEVNTNLYPRSVWERSSNTGSLLGVGKFSRQKVEFETLFWMSRSFAGKETDFIGSLTTLLSLDDATIYQVVGQKVWLGGCYM